MSDIRLSVHNVGGIAGKTFDFNAGTTLVVGTNASNKTSLLQSLQFVLGSDKIPLRSGADEAITQLDYDGRTVKRIARNNRAGIEIDGSGWVQDEDDRLLVERFACLLRTNPLRSAIVHGEDVETLLKEPMDIEALEDERTAKLNRKRELQRDVEQLTGVEEQLRNRRQELAETHDRINDFEAQLEDLYTKQEATDVEDEQLQSLREERTNLRAERDQYQNQIDELEDGIARLKDQQQETKSELSDMRETADSNNVEKLKQQRENIQEELTEVTDRMDILQSVLTTNQEMLNSEFSGSLGYDSGLMEDKLACWACGGSATAEDFQKTITELQDLVEHDKKRKREREPELTTIEEQIEEANKAQRQIQNLEANLNDIDQRLQQRCDSLERKREELDRLESELANIDEQIATQQDEQAGTRSDLADDIEETRIELQTLRRDVDRLESTVEDLEAKREKHERKREEIEEITGEIQSLTDRIENLEGELRTVFNQAMDELIDTLEFEQIERIRLDGSFNIVIARQVDGTIRKDAVDHLAESEREIIGLVLGLAGFVAYDVSEISPMLLLDSLSAFDITRTERLIEYFAEKTDMFFAAIHPEAADQFEYQTLNMA